MLYSFFKPLAALALKGFFKKIILTGLENLPEDKSVILAANHPTAFVEPCILAAQLNRPLYFLVRGDYFRKPVYNFILRTLHMLPIFRRMDGNFSDLKNNVKILDACSDALAAKKTIMILAEGRTKHEKRLRPIQKGTARLAFSTLHKHPNLPLVVVPVSVNFTNSLKWRSQVMIHFGEPIEVKPFYDQFYTKPAEAVNSFTQTIHDELKKFVIHVNEKKWDKTADKLLIIARNQVKVPDSKLVPLQIELSAVEKFNEKEDDTKQLIKTQLKNYFKQLKKNKLNDRQVSLNPKFSFPLFFRVLVGFLPAIPGFLLNVIPVFIAKGIIDLRVSSKTYKTPVFIASLIGVHLLFFLITLIISCFTGYFTLIFLQPLAILSGLFSVHYWDFLNEFIQSFRWWRLSIDEKDQWIQERNSILHNIS